MLTSSAHRCWTLTKAAAREALETLDYRPHRPMRHVVPFPGRRREQR